MIVGRFGGDEFIIGAHVDFLADVFNIKDSINEEIKKLSDANQKEYDLVFSIGYAIYSQELNTIKDLIEEADKMLYDEKIKIEGETRG